MIGPGVVGHWVAPGERDVPDPDEYLKVNARSVRPRNGLLSFRFLEPMEETVYLDQVRLLAIDHPAAYEVNPNERFVSAPPFPEFRVIASRDARPPLGAWDDRGNNVLPLLAKRDRQYVTDFAAAPFVGFAQLHWVELDLGNWDAAKPLRLIMDGYTDYFTATSMYAADQAGVKVIAPYVEALDAQGNWKRVIDDMGFPAGLERTMVADLSGKIPPGTRRIRIVNNLKIYWDAIRIDQTPDTNDVHVEEVPLATASLEFLGFPLEQRLKPASDTTYSFAHRSKTGPYARAAGNYTRYGDVHDLLKSSDDRFTVFGSGEGLKLDFDPRKLPPLPAGWVRDYFFYADGFEKDLDFYAAHAFTVEPLPRHTLVALPLSRRPGLSLRPRPPQLPARIQHPRTLRPPPRHAPLPIPAQSQSVSAIFAKKINAHKLGIPATYTNESFRIPRESAGEESAVPAPTRRAKTYRVSQQPQRLYPSATLTHSLFFALFIIASHNTNSSCPVLKLGNFCAAPKSPASTYS